MTVQLVRTYNATRQSTDQSHGRSSDEKEDTRKSPIKAFLDDVITNCGAGGYGQMKQLARDRYAWRDSA